MASEKFINECKNRAYANRLGKIIVDNFESPITNSDKLQSFSIDGGCYIDGNIIGSVYAKCLKASFVSDISNLIGKDIQAQIGIKYDDLSNEYINMGKYTIERPNNEKTVNMSQINAYDSLYTNLEEKYVCNIDYNAIDEAGNIIEIHLSDLYIDVCKQLNLKPKTINFLNGDIPIYSNPFTNGEKNRTVLQTIAKISCSFIDIDNDTNEIDLCWLSDNEEPDYTFYKNDYSSVEGGEIVCGPINCLIIKNSAIDDENVTIKDEESISLYGEHSITISEDYVLYNANLRQLAINSIWNRVRGLKYVDCKLTTYYGKPFLKLGNKIRVYIDENKYFDTYVLKHNFTYDGSFTSIIEGRALTEQEIKTKQDIGLKEALRNTQIEVNKQTGVITSLTEKTEILQENLTNNYYTITKVNELVQTSETGITNTFSEAGGNNIFKNTGLWFEEDSSISHSIYPGNGLYPGSGIYPGGGSSRDTIYEFWIGRAKLGSNDKSSNTRSILCQSGTLSQEQEVPNGNYTVSFIYKKSNSLIKASVKINDDEYKLDSLTDTEFCTGNQDKETGEYLIKPLVVNSRHIKVSFITDVDDGLEIYDLMVNKGSVKLAYSQNQNETITDTVNISKGITITSTNSNAILKANADGIRILTLQNNAVAYFTDKGLNAKEITVENTAQICGTLVNQVGNQTWFTRM